MEEDDDFDVDFGEYDDDNYEDDFEEPVQKVGYGKLDDTCPCGLTVKDCSASKECP